jgi:hypothetical protein
MYSPVSRSSYYSEGEAVMVEVRLNQFWGDTLQEHIIQIQRPHLAFTTMITSVL